MVSHGEEGVGEQLVRNVAWKMARRKKVRGTTCKRPIAPPIVALVMCKKKKNPQNEIK